MSGRSRCSSASISLPSAAQATSNPSRRMKSATSRLISGSSSTIRIVGEGRRHGAILNGRANQAQGPPRACYTLLHEVDKTTKDVAPQQNGADTAPPVSLAWRPQWRLHPSRRPAMKKLVLTSAFIGALTVAAVADANAWTRSGTATGPRGTLQRQRHRQLRERHLHALGDPNRTGRQHRHPPEHDLALLTARDRSRPRCASGDRIPAATRYLSGDRPCPGFPFLAVPRSRAGWLALIVVTPALAPSLAHAQTRYRCKCAARRLRSMQVCRADYDRLCPGVVPGGGRVLACLQSHANQLSATCAQAMPRAQALRDSAAAAGVLPK